MKAEIEKILSEPTASVPDAGIVFGLGRNASYAAASRGEIPTLRFGSKLRVPTAVLRKMIGQPVATLRNPPNEKAARHDPPLQD
jgi:hypothetical protein